MFLLNFLGYEYMYISKHKLLVFVIISLCVQVCVNVFFMYVCVIFHMYASLLDFSAYKKIKRNFLCVFICVCVCSGIFYIRVFLC